MESINPTNLIIGIMLFALVTAHIAVYEKKDRFNKWVILFCFVAAIANIVIAFI